MSAAVGLTPENPWPGLAAFTENDQSFFFGRDKEVEELLRVLRRETLTVLFGQSGLGKTSLLQAGLFPKLRQEDYLPVFVRLDHTPGAPPLQTQVLDALLATAAQAEVEAPAPINGESLWEYFHGKDAAFWSARQRLLEPVLVLDQFEELLTLGAATEASRARGAEFLGQLAELIDNRPPAALHAAIERGERKADEFNFDPAHCRVLLSLREDFLADLESLRPLIGGDARNRMRLRRMNGEQAMGALLGAGSQVLDADTAGRIVSFVAGVDAGDGATTGPVIAQAELEIEPALLCLVCHELNLKRQGLGEKKITVGLLTGSRQEILSDFYDRCFVGLPPAARTFVEDRLLTRSGFRNNVALEDAISADGITRAAIDTLVSCRLLRLEERLGVARVELTHDVLTAPIRASRRTRTEKNALAAADDAAHRLLKARRRLVATVVAAAVIISAMGGLVYFSIGEWKKAESNLQMAHDSAQLAEQKELDATAENLIFEDILGGGAQALGKDKDKVTVLQAALVAAQELDNGRLQNSPMAEATVRETIGKALSHLAHYREAEDNLKRALAIIRKEKPPNAARIADLQQNLGLTYEGQQKYPLALDAYHESAAAGNTKASYNLGYMYMVGHGVDLDYRAAMVWYGKAADAKDLDAMTDVGYLFETGLGVQRDYAQAYTWYRKAADAGNAGAMRNVGRLYENGTGAKQDYAAAHFWYRKAADAGSLTALRNIGALYELGHGLPQSFAKAKEFYEQAANAGNADAMVDLGVLYDKGLGILLDHAKALEWYQKAADAGSDTGIRFIGIEYEIGHGVKQDYTQAMTWYHKAVDAGNVDAQVNIGRLFELGHGVPQSFAQAMVWYRKSVEAGSASAMVSLGLLFDNGHGVPQDFAEALRLYHQAADAGDAEGMRNVGIHFESGEGVTQDYAKARQWYEKAAQAGSTDALSSIGNLYGSGHGVPQDYSMAAEWYEKAAKMGDPDGDNNLGVLYEMGKGVPRDFAKAFDLYQLAADAGNPVAAHNIACIYDNGHGEPKNSGLAQDWFRKAADMGDDTALAVVYENGLGVNVDYPRALELYHKAAASEGSSTAMLKIGGMYEHGRGVPQNYASAMEWYHKAVDGGEFVGMIRIGDLFAQGLGVKQDDAEALQWYQKAADAGDGEAMLKLGKFYESGRGVPKDSTQARAWYKKSAAAKNQDAKAALQRLGG